MSWSDRNYSDGGGYYGASGGQRGTWWLIGLTFGLQVVIWVLGGGTFGGGTDSVIRWFGLDLEYWWQPWRLVTYAFLHGSVRHFFFNMLLIYFIGRMLEEFFGTRHYLKLYLGFAAFAGLGFYLESAMVSRTQCIGASGAAMGLVALLGSRFPMLEIMLLGVIRMRCWAMAAILVGLDLLSAAADQGMTTTAHSVHLAGAFAGFFYGFLWPKLSVKLEDAQAERQVKVKHKQQERARQNDAEMDRILQKVHDEGMDKLSPKEREFLLAQSERLKGSGKN